MTLGGKDLYYHIKFKDTSKWFRWHMVPEEKTVEKKVFLSEDLYRERRKEFPPGTPEGFMEYRILVEETGRVLCEEGIFIIHATAFFWNQYAWLLTAPSGTGKTTQFNNWKRLWRDEVEILCGDMPVLRTDQSERIWVCPSPWNGKERMGFENHTDYPLGGIVFLKQADENRISSIDLHKMVWPIWHQFLGQCNTERQIRSRERFMNLLLDRYPVWLLENRGDEDSARMTRHVFEDYLNGKKNMGRETS